MVKRLLVIDDDDDIREVVTLLFEHRGFAVDALADGIEAVHLAKDYDVILLDLNMPVFDGDLDNIKHVVRLGGFINSDPAFLDGPKVMNGASDLMVAVLSDKGRHARTTVGVAVLPADAAVEVEGAFEVT